METVKVKCYSPIWSLVTGILCLLAGLFMLFGDKYYSTAILVIIAVVLLVMAGVREFHKSFEEQRIKKGILLLSVYIILAIALYFFYTTFINLLNIILAVLAFALFLMRATILIHMIRNGISGLIRNIISMMICLFFGIALVAYPATDKVEFAINMSGIFLILMALSQFAEFYTDATGANLLPDKLTRNIYFSMPNAVTALMTKRLVDMCNDYVADHEDATTYTVEKEGTDQSAVNFEIMVHTTRKPGDFLGHVDVCIGDKVYTYGSYDSTAHRLGILIAGGTFIVNPREAYIKNCLNDQKKYLLGYGCALSDEQLKAVRDRIDEIFRDTEEIKVDESRVDDSVKMFWRIGGKPYRVVRGPFKTYYAIASNCVKLADSIAGRAGLDRVSKGSLTTPGAYLCMLENMFTRQNTRVIRRTFYLQTEAGHVKTEQERIKNEKSQAKR